MTLGISESTVNWHIANAFERLGASSRAEAVAIAMRSDGADRAPEPVARAGFAPAPPSWPRLVAIAIAIAVAGALLGGATVATLQLGPAHLPSASPANGSDRAPRASPPGGSTADPTRGPLQDAPATLPPLPAVSAPPLRSVPVPLPTPALPSLPVTPPPLPTPSIPLPIPTPSLPLR